LGAKLKRERNPEFEMHKEDVRQQWRERGFAILPHLLDIAQVTHLHSICEAALEKWRTLNQGVSLSAANMMHLTSVEYFKDDPRELLALLEIISDERVLTVLELLTDDPPLFNNTQYLFNPKLGVRAGEWHRDAQFGAPDEATERIRMAKLIAVHLQIALLPDDSVEYVSESQSRLDTLEERQIRRGLNGKEKTSSEMPGAVRILLNRGDGLVFNGWGIHRGHLYDSKKPRSVLDITYGSGRVDWYTPPPTCFSSTAWVSGLKPHALLFYERFINAYSHKWEKGEYDY
jgi:hypothetical protein